jgi:hypothetical protein
MTANVNSPTVEDVYRVLGRSNGKRPILLPIEARQKAPRWPDWQKTTYQDSLKPEYQRQLKAKSNTGVLLGGIDNLCTIDFDTDAALDEFLLNPQFETTLRTHGKSGAQLWAYVTGNRPHKVEKLTVRQNSPLAANARKQADRHGNIQIGEFRAEGGQSIIRGIHPDGCAYTWPVVAHPITVDLDAIVWPEDIRLPWLGQRPAGANGIAGDSLLNRAIEKVTIEQLWQYFSFEPRTKNQINSPFRDDQHPSFSIYDQGRRWKDHGTGDGGDSFDFFQRATGKTAREAFVDFVELAGFGTELKGPRNRNKGRIGTAVITQVEEKALKSAHSTADIAKTVGIYYDPERACYWLQDDRENWIKINETSVTRHLTERGYHKTKREQETISETDLILNEIQRSMNVEYAGPLAGCQKGIREYSGKRLLITDSPKLIEPKQGDWPMLCDFLATLLDAENTDQIVFFHGWMKHALLALRAQHPRPGQAVVLAGKKTAVNRYSKA